MLVLREQLQLLLLLVQSVVLLARAEAAAHAVGSVSWSFHAWRIGSTEKLQLPSFESELPADEEEAMRIICDTVTQLPADSQLLAVSGSSFHPSLRRFCGITGAACAFTGDAGDFTVPTSWLGDSLLFYPTPQLQSKAVESFLDWAMWNSFAVFFTKFGDLSRIRSILEYSDREVKLREVNLTNSKQVYTVLQQLKYASVNRFVLDIPHTEVPQFLNLASAANLTSMAYNYLLVRWMDSKFYAQNIAARLFSGVNCTLLQTDAIRFGADETAWRNQSRQANRHSALLFVLQEARRRFLESFGSDTSPFVGGRQVRVSDSDAWLLPGCYAATNAGNATRLFRSLLQEETQRLLGTVQLSGQPVLNFTFTLHHMYPESLTQVAGGDTELQFGIAHFASWTANGGFRLAPEAQNRHQTYFNRLLHDMNLSVVTVNEPPFSFRREFDEDGRRLEGNDQWTGFSIELFKKVADLLNCKYSIHLSNDGQFGSPRIDESGRQAWSGMVGELMRGEADVAVASLVITYDRERVIDFTTPYRSLGLSILTKQSDEEQNLFQFLLPFSKRVWVYMLLAWLLASLCLFVCARLSPYEWYSQSACVPVVENQFNALNSLWFTIGSLMQQGSDLAPRASSTRMVGTVWWFFTLILISSYTANLAAFLTVTRLNSIDSLEALASQTKVKFGCATGGAMYNFFKNSKIPLYKRMWDSMVAWNASGESFVKNTKEGLKRVRGGGFALVLESTFNEYHRERDCNLTKIGGIFNPSSYAFAVRQGNLLLKDKLSEVILKLHKEQYIEDLSDKWLKRFNVSSKPCSELTTSSSASTGTLDVGSVGGVFVTLLLGLGIAVLFSVVELLYRGCVLAARSKTPFCQHCRRQLVLAASLHKHKLSESETARAKVKGEASSYTLDAADRKMPLCGDCEQQL